MALTRNDFTGDGVTTVYDVSFTLGFLQQSDIFVSLDTNEHTDQLSYTFLNATQIVMTTPVGNGIEFNIRRVVDRSKPINDYEEGAILREKNLDDSFLQALMILQEIEDGYFVTSGVLSLEVDLNMQLHKILNLSNAVGALDAVNLGQLTQIVASADALAGFTRTIPLSYPRQLGDGSTVTFQTPATETIPASSIFVNLDGVTQRPDTDYVVNLSGQCVFVEAPEAKTDIDITLFAPTTINTGTPAVIPILQPRQQGDGTTTLFATPATTMETVSSFFIHLDGVAQRPIIDYSINATGQCLFVEAPEEKVDIDITFFQPSNGGTLTETTLKLKSPDNAVWDITVTNAGVLIVTAA